MKKIQRPDSNYFKRIFDHFKIKGLRKPLEVRFYKSDEFNAFKEGKDNDFTKYFVPPYICNKADNEFWGVRLERECFVNFMFKPQTILYTLLSSHSERSDVVLVTARAMFDYVNLFKTELFRTMAKGFFVEDKQIVLVESTAMIRMTFLLEMILTEMQYPYLSDILLEFTRFIMMDHPTVQIKKYTDIINSLPNCIFYNSNPYPIPKFSGETIEVDVSWKDNYFTIMMDEDYKSMITGLKELGLNEMANLILEKKDFSSDTFILMEVLYGLQYSNGYCNSSAYLSAIRQITSGQKAIVEERGLNVEKAKAQAIKDWDNPELKMMDNYEDMKKDYFETERYKQDYVDEDSFLDIDDVEKLNIRNSFISKIQLRIKDIKNSTDINKVSDYNDLFRMYYTKQTSKSAGGAAIKIMSDPPIELKDKNKIAPFLVDEMKNYTKMINMNTPITLGSRIIPGPKLSRNIFNINLQQYFFMIPAYDILTAVMSKMPQFANTTGDNFKDHGVMFMGTTNVGYMLVSVDISQWDGNLTTDKRKYFRIALKDEFGWHFTDAMTIGELSYYINIKTYRSPVVVYNPDRGIYEIWFVCIMKSGELLTAHENSITNMCIIEVIHDVINVNNLKVVTKGESDKAKGDDGFFDYLTRKFTVVIENGEKKVLYSDDAIKEFNMVRGAVSLVYGAMLFKQNILKGGTLNDRSTYLKKTVISGYMFNNQRIRLFTVEQPLAVERKEMLGTTIAKVRMMVERGGNLDVLYNILIKLMITSSPIKIYEPFVKGTKKIKDDTQRFVCQMFFTLCLRVEDGGVSLPIIQSLIVSPNASMLNTKICYLRNDTAYKFDDILQFYRGWNELNESNSYVRIIVDKILSNKFKLASRNLYGLVPKLNIDAFNQTLIQERVRLSGWAFAILKNRGITVPRLVRYDQKIYRMFNIAMKGSNLNSTNRGIRANIVDNLYKSVGQKSFRSRTSLMDEMIKLINVEFLSDTYERSKLPNVAIGSGKIFRDVIDVLGYAQADKIQPLTLQSLQRILDRDVNGPKDIKAEVLLKLFMDPQYGLQKDNMGLLLQTVGFSDSISTAVIEEIQSRQIYYLFVESLSYSYMTETAALANFSTSKMDELFEIQTSYKILEPIMYGMGILILFELMESNDNRRFRIYYDSELMKTALGRFGYRV
jgi:hypothetical protein